MKTQLSGSGPGPGAPAEAGDERVLPGKTAQRAGAHARSDARGRPDFRNVLLSSGQQRRVPPLSAGQATATPSSQDPCEPTFSGTVPRAKHAPPARMDTVDGLRADAGAGDLGTDIDEEEHAPEWTMLLGPHGGTADPGGDVQFSEAPALGGGATKVSGDTNSGALSVAVPIGERVGPVPGADASQAPGSRTYGILAEGSAAVATGPDSLRLSIDQIAMMPAGTAPVAGVLAPVRFSGIPEAGLSDGANADQRHPTDLIREPAIPPARFAVSLGSKAAAGQSLLGESGRNELKELAGAGSGVSGRAGSEGSTAPGPLSFQPLSSIGAGPQGDGPEIAAIRVGASLFASPDGPAEEGTDGSVPPYDAMEGAQWGPSQAKRGGGSRLESAPAPGASRDGTAIAAMFGPASRAGPGSHVPDAGTGTNAGKLRRGSGDFAQAKGTLGRTLGDQMPGRDTAQGAPDAAPVAAAILYPGQARRAGRIGMAAGGTSGLQTDAVQLPDQSVGSIAEGGDQVELAGHRGDASVSVLSQAQIESGASGARGQSPAANTPQASSFRQVAEAIVASDGGRVDVRLEPEELGRVRFHMQVTDHGIALQVTAERAETLEMMRRHADLLARHLSDAGFPGSSFSFAGERRGRPGMPTSEAPASNETTPAERVATASDISSADPTTRDGLDLRL